MKNGIFFPSLFITASGNPTFFSKLCKDSKVVVCRVFLSLILSIINFDLAKVNIKSRIVKSENQPEIKIDWRVYTKNKEKPLIRDLIVEGLSLARTQKEEFSSILNSNNNDINILISKLEDFLKS